MITRTHKHHHPGLRTLASGRRVYVTRSGLQIGCRYQPPARDQGKEAERVQAMLLHRRPLAIDQIYVMMMCTEARP